MKTDKHKTKVQFLLDPCDNDEQPQVFAFFPELIDRTRQGVNFYTSYAHIGQHCDCVKEYADNCSKATPEQYKYLKEELISIGYNLKIV